MGSRGQFVVSVTDLDLAGRRLVGEITPAWLRGALEGCEIQPAGPSGMLDLHVGRVGQDVLARGRIHVALETPCARCLEPVRLDIDTELSLLFTRREAAFAPRHEATGPGATGGRAPSGRRRARQAGGRSERLDGGEGDRELTADEVEREVFEGEEIVLDPYVREAILLESPNFPLCSEACEGIRPRSEEGQTLAPQRGEVSSGLDPRLSPLLEIVGKKPQEN